MAIPSATPKYGNGIAPTERAGCLYRLIHHNGIGAIGSMKARKRHRQQGDDAQAAYPEGAPDMHGLLADLPPALLYDLGLAPAVRLVARGDRLDDGAIDRVVTACWRAVTRPGME